VPRRGFDLLRARDFVCKRRKGRLRRNKTYRRLAAALARKTILPMVLVARERGGRILTTVKTVARSTRDCNARHSRLCDPPVAANDQSNRKDCSDQQVGQDTGHLIECAQALVGLRLFCDVTSRDATE
jgi:hypothetical protein